MCRKAMTSTWAYPVFDTRIYLMPLSSAELTDTFYSDVESREPVVGAALKKYTAAAGVGI